jgi:hypothetical protein
MATIATYIDNFLRDAQYRVGQLTAEIDTIEDNGSYQYREKRRQRLELTTFMDVLYEGKWYITSGYNHIQYGGGGTDENTWTEREIIQEIEHLRYYTEMNEVPFINFTAHYPQIVNFITGAGGSGSVTGVPAGLYGMSIFYNASAQAYADYIDPYGGMYTAESISSYFNGRI